jgi:hypothetical protein
MIEGSSFSDPLTRVEIGHMRIRVTRVGFVAKPTGIIILRQNDRHPVMDNGHELIGISGDDCKSPNPFA